MKLAVIKEYKIVKQKELDLLKAEETRGLTSIDLHDPKTILHNDPDEGKKEEGLTEGQEFIAKMEQKMINENIHINS